MTDGWSWPFAALGSHSGRAGAQPGICIGRRRGRRHGSDGACGNRRRAPGRGRGGVDCPAGLLVNAAAARRTRDDGGHHASGGRLPGARRRRHLRRCRRGGRLGVDGHVGGLDPGGSGDDGRDVAHRPCPRTEYRLRVRQPLGQRLLGRRPGRPDVAGGDRHDPDRGAGGARGGRGQHLDQSARLQGGAPHRPADEQDRGDDRRGPPIWRAGGSRWIRRSSTATSGSRWATAPRSSASTPRAR